MLRFRGTWVAMAALLIAVACGSAPGLLAAPVAVPTDEATITAEDIKFDPTNLTVAPGATITLVNRGVLPHNFSLDALHISIDIDPDSQAQATIPTDAKPGSYQFYCNVPGHREAGMVGTLVVAEASPSPSGKDATIAALQTRVAGLSASGTATATPATFGAEQAGTGKTVNVELIVDSSGSMANPLDTGETRMEAAKRVLDEVVNAIPNRPGINVGLRIYGHRGDNSEATKQESCNASDLVVPVNGVDKQRLLDKIAALQPTGWTPIATSLERASQDFPPASADATNAVVLVTDGVETCDGDPCGTAAALNSGPVHMITDVIGFATTAEDQQTLSCIAAGGKGKLLGAGNAQELDDALFKVLSELKVASPKAPTPTPTGPLGTRTNPVPMGSAHDVGDWTITVTSVDPHADEAVAAQNQFNKPPAAGFQFYMATVSATYHGQKESGQILTVAFKAVGQSGVAYTTYSPSCGVVPDALPFTDVFQGGTITGNVCWSVKQSDADSLVMFAQPLAAINLDRVFFALRQ